MTNYSQGREQSVILAVFGPKIGTFLDIGAYHPTELSNTRALIERGWRGTLIEPNPYSFEIIRKARVGGGGPQTYAECERLNLVLAAVDIDRKILKMHGSESPMTTACDSVRDRWKQSTPYWGDFFIPTVTIEDVCKQFGPFDMISIDCEGMSFDVAKHLPLDARHTKLICIEHDGRLIELGEHMQEFGYVQKWIGQENAIYVLEEAKKPEKEKDDA